MSIAIKSPPCGYGWRVTHLFHAEDGPGAALVWVRRHAGIGFFGSLMDCFYCLSLWISVPFAWLLGEGWTDRTLLRLAFSARAILVERITNRAVPSAHYIEDKEFEDGMLLSKTKSAQRTDADQADE